MERGLQARAIAVVLIGLFHLMIYGALESGCGATCNGSATRLRTIIPRCLSSAPPIWYHHAATQLQLTFHLISSHGICSYAGNVTIQLLTHPSAPAATTSLSPSFHNTTFTPPGTAFLISTFRIGLALLQTYTCVSSEPDTQYCESDDHAREVIRPEWNDQRVVSI